MQWTFLKTKEPLDNYKFSILSVNMTLDRAVKETVKDIYVYFQFLINFSFKISVDRYNST